MRYILILLSLTFVLSLTAQDSISSLIYGSNLDDDIADAELLSNGEVLVIGTSDSSNQLAYPLLFTVDSNLNIKDFSFLYSKLDAKLRLIIKFENQLYILASADNPSSTTHFLLLEIHGDFSYTLVDSINTSMFYPSIRGYKVHNDHAYIVGDGAPQKNPADNNAFILSINSRNNQLSFSEIALKGYNFAFDIYCKEDSSFVMTLVEITTEDPASRVKVCTLSKDLIIENCNYTPLSIQFNTKILSVSDTNIILSGRSSQYYPNPIDDQLLVASFNQNSDTLKFIDSLQFGKYYKDEVPAFRAVTGSHDNYYIGGTSGFDAFSYPFTYFENHYIVASFDKQFNKRFTRYIGLKNNYIVLTKTIPLNNENSILLVGTSFNFRKQTQLRQRDIYIVRLDSLGNIATGLPPELLAENDFLLYPNPGSDYLQVSLPNASSGRFALYDMQGRLIEWQLFRQHLQINTAGLPAGIYIYRISDEKERQHFGKWIKQ